MSEVFAENLLRNPITIGEPNKTVEIDETMFTTRKITKDVNCPSSGFLVSFVVILKNASWLPSRIEVFLTDTNNYAIHLSWNNYYVR